MGVEGMDRKVSAVLQQLMLSASAELIILNWRVTYMKLQILLLISLGAQLPNRRHTFTSLRWQHGHRTPVSLGTGKSNLLGSLPLCVPV